MSPCKLLRYRLNETDPSTQAGSSGEASDPNFDALEIHFQLSGEGWSGMA